MNMLMAATIDFSEVQLRDVDVPRLYSATGLVYGLAAWFESDIVVEGELAISALSAGLDYADRDGTITYEDLPNKAAEACAVRLFDADDYPLSMHWSQELTASQSCVQGMVGCLGEKHKFTHFQHVVDASESVCPLQSRPFELAPATLQTLKERRALQKEVHKGGTSAKDHPHEGRMGWLKRKIRGLFRRKGKGKSKQAGAEVWLPWLATSTLL